MTLKEMKFIHNGGLNSKDYRLETDPFFSNFDDYIKQQRFDNLGLTNYFQPQISEIKPPIVQPSKVNNAANGVNIAQNAVGFASDTYDAFKSSTSADEFSEKYGTSYVNAGGFSYQKQNYADADAERKAQSGEAVGNTFKSIGSGAALGASVASVVPGIGTAIGGAVGAVVGGLTGLFGGLAKRKKLNNQLKEQQRKALAYNNFSYADAQSDYLASQYKMNHYNT